VTAYGSSWRSGDVWPEGPDPIPMNYVTRCGYLWRQGEVYHYDDANTPPLSWKPGTAGSLAMGKSSGVAKSVADSSAGYVTARRTIEEAGADDGQLVVSILVAPGDAVGAYAVEESPPANRTIIDISEGGVVGPAGRAIRWGPFFDTQPRTLSYALKPRMGADGTETFTGQVSADGASIDIGGDKMLKYVDGPFRWTCGSVMGLSGLAIYLCGSALGMLMLRRRVRRR
jgi:hypothetical protein